jgi:hypothetical protein
VVSDQAECQRPLTPIRSTTADDSPHLKALLQVELRFTSQLNTVDAYQPPKKAYKQFILLFFLRFFTLSANQYVVPGCKQNAQNLKS